MIIAQRLRIVFIEIRGDCASHLSEMVMKALLKTVKLNLFHFGGIVIKYIFDVYKITAFNVNLYSDWIELLNDSYLVIGLHALFWKKINVNQSFDG